MTKKHFVAFAAFIKAELDAGNICKPVAYKMADLIIDVARDANPHFDRERFVKACGLVGGVDSGIQSGQATAGTMMLGSQQGSLIFSTPIKTATDGRIGLK